jgi:hypothetical protein
MALADADRRDVDLVASGLGRKRSLTLAAG